MKVTLIRPTANALSAKFDEIVRDASDLAIIAVKRDGSIVYLINDNLTQGAALVGALEIAKADLIASQFDDV